MFRISAIFDRISEEFPRSIDALRLSKGRSPLRGLDLGEVRRIATQFAELNPKRAKTIRKEIVPSTYSDDRSISPTDGQGQGAARPSQPSTPTGDGDTSKKDTTKTARDQNNPILVLDLNPKPAQQDTIVTQPDPNYTAPVEKRTKLSVKRQIRRSTVLILHIVQVSGKFYQWSSGTGFFINPNTIVTNAHVLASQQHPDLLKLVKSKGLRYEDDIWLVVSPHIGVLPAQLLSSAWTDSPYKVDAGVLRIGRSFPDMTMPLQLSSGADLWIASAGYPGNAGKISNETDYIFQSVLKKKALARDKIPQAVMVEGNVARLTWSANTKARLMQYTMETAPGASGSPIVNACGEVVGLHFAGNRLEVDGKSVIGGKYNSAYMARDVAIFLEHARVDFRKAERECQVSFN